MKPSSLARNQNGFSLLEVIIAGAMMAFFAMVMLQSNEMQSRMVLTNEAQMETFTLLFQVQQVLSDPVSCSISVGQAFGKVTDLHDLEKKPPAPLKTLYRSFKNAAGGFEATKFLVVGENRPGNVIRVTDLQLVPHPTFDGQIDLVLTIERLKKGVLGGVTTVKRIPINIDLIGPQYANAFDGIMCLNPAQPSTGNQSQISNAIRSAIRSGMGDSGMGSDSTKNVLAKACADAGGKWNARENRCGSDASPEEALAALRTACATAGGTWNGSSQQCGVSVAR
jgi:hypothetical protein